MARHRLRADRHFRLVLDVLLQHGAEIHPVQLVARKDQHMVGLSVQHVAQPLPHRVGRALEPRLAAGRLLRRQDAHVAAVELVEDVGALHVLVQRHAVELRQHVDAPDAAVDAVADGNVHQPVLARQRHRRLAPVARQGLQPLAFSTAQNHAHHIHHPPRCRRRKSSAHHRGEYRPAARSNQP
jgi:hypothetical protein